MNIINSIPVADGLVYNNKPIYIIILDSRTPSITIDQMNKIHKMNGLKMYAYHYFISRQGEIYRGRPENAYAADVEEINKINKDSSDSPLDDKSHEVINASNLTSTNKIFICIEGNTEMQQVPTSQYNAITELCKDLMERYYNIKNIYSLSDLCDIDNLGSYFDMNSLRSSVMYTNLPLYTIGLNGNITYSFGKRILYYDDENILYGNDVKLLQLYLKALNIPVEKKNGIYDLFTLNSVKAFQEVYKLDVTGRMETVDYDTLLDAIDRLQKKRNKYDYHRLLYYSSDNIISGNDVIFVQNKLKGLKNYGITESSGYYDKETEDAVKAFQLANDIEVDGIVGPITYSTLKDSIIIEFTRILKYVEDNMMSGTDVDFVQSQIKKSMRKFGITNISMSGYYDLVTSNNIKLIQKSQFIPITGEVDSVMWTFLNKL